jgi:hypothetical protein
MSLTSGFVHMMPSQTYDAGTGLRASADALEAEWTAANGQITTEEGGIGRSDLMSVRFREHYDAPAERVKTNAARRPGFFRKTADAIQRSVDEYLATEEENRRNLEPPR